MKNNPYTFSQNHPLPSVGTIIAGSFGFIFGLCEHPLIAYNKKILEENHSQVLNMEGKSLNFDIKEYFLILTKNEK